MKILYIEDNPIDVDLTLRKLKRDTPDIVIDTATSQAEALLVLKSPEFSDYDLVLTDMQLPDGNGIAILSHIRGMSLSVAVVILTGQGDEEAAVAALKAGADDYIVKKRGYLDDLSNNLEMALDAYLRGKDENLQQLNVLYIEHNQVDVDLTSRHLTRYAPHIKMEALHRVSDFYVILDRAENLAQYSALLLDYRLPQENALEILKKIILSTSRKIPVILVTGKGDEEIAVKALKMGAFDYVIKDQGYLFKLPSIIENAYYSMRLAREHEALLESEKRYRALFEENHEVMLLMDPESGQIVDANSAAARFYGWSYEQLTAKNISEINSLAASQLRDTARIVVQGELNKTITRHQRADGSICDVEVYSNPIEVGGQTLLYAKIYDISERIASEQEREKLHRKLVQAQKMEAFGQLAGGISHDFNNILSAVIGYTELAIDQVEKSSPLEEDLQEIYTAGKRARDLVQQILAFARQSDEEEGPVVVSSIAKEVLKLIRSSTPATIDIKHNISSNSIIIGNAIQIHQIIMNLCSNAVYAMDDGGLLEFSLEDVKMSHDSSIHGSGASERYIKMTISDTGSGIPPDIIESIYEPYFTTKPLGEGTGMGLSMVHGIVMSYGGKITVTSELARGTTFGLYLPIVNKSLKSTSSELLELPTGNEKILLVDDEVPIAKLEGQLLERLGYTVTVMTNSTETLRLFRQNPYDYDLVLTDTNMPNLSGDNLAIELMRIRPDIPVILCTGYSKKVTDDLAREIGLKAFIYKPIVKEQLATTVRAILDEAKVA
jgi:PAS domain S-box-containing protein